MAILPRLFHAHCSSTGFLQVQREGRKEKFGFSFEVNNHLQRFLETQTPQTAFSSLFVSPRMLLTSEDSGSGEAGTISQSLGMRASWAPWQDGWDVCFPAPLALPLQLCTTKGCTGTALLKPFLPSETERKLGDTSEWPCFSVFLPFQGNRQDTLFELAQFSCSKGQSADCIWRSLSVTFCAFSWLFSLGIDTASRTHFETWDQVLKCHGEYWSIVFFPGCILIWFWR